MFDKYSMIIAIACIIGISIMYCHEQTQEDWLISLLIIPVIMFFYVKHILKRDGFR